MATSCSRRSGRRRRQERGREEKVRSSLHPRRMPRIPQHRMEVRSVRMVQLFPLLRGQRADARCPPRVQERGCGDGRAHQERLQAVPEMR